MCDKVSLREKISDFMPNSYRYRQAEGSTYARSFSQNHDGASGRRGESI